MNQKIGWILASCALACLLAPSASAAKSYTVTVEAPEVCWGHYSDASGCTGLGDANTAGLAGVPACDASDAPCESVPMDLAIATVCVGHSYYDHDGSGRLDCDGVYVVVGP
jgi:hypothetical protein